MMNKTQNSVEVKLNVQPEQLLADLEAIATDQMKWNHLRSMFLEESDVDEYIEELDANDDLELTKKQLKRFKETLEGYKVYLSKYLGKTAKRIESLDQRLNKITEKFGDPDLDPAAIDSLVSTRKKIALAMQMAKEPRGLHGKSLREVTGEIGATKKELLPKQQEKILADLKLYFDKFSHLHESLIWTDVERALKEDPEVMKKLDKLNKCGFEMTVMGEMDGEIIFRTAQTEVDKIDNKYRNLFYDETCISFPPGVNVSLDGFVEGQVAFLGAKLAEPKLYEKFRVKRGAMFLKTDEATRKAGEVYVGDEDGVKKVPANKHSGFISFCPVVKVKKV